MPSSFPLAELNLPEHEISILPQGHRVPRLPLEPCFSLTQAESKFVFVPGPGDAGPAHVLPRPPLACSLTADLREALPNAVFASNPCRIRYGTQELVLFRDDVQQRMRRQVLMPPSGGWLT